jgi:hypothetical protein
MMCRMLRQVVLMCSVLFVTQSVMNVVYADDAAVLPKGSWRVMTDAQYYLPWTKQFDQDGNVEALGAPYSVDLNSQVFPALAPFGPGATLGQSVVSLKREGTVITMQIAYGLTDRISVGINIPYYWARTDVNAKINTSSATLGINPLGPGGLAPCAAPGCNSPADVAAGTRPATVQDINNILVSLGFKPLKTYSHEGLGDIEVGGKYQYFNSEHFRAAFTGGVRFPTGFKDDPNNLVDFGEGNGVYALLFQLQQDYLHQSPGIGKRLGFPDPGEYLVNATVRYDLNLPDNTAIRVCSISLPTCPYYDPSAHRDLGDNLEAEISTKIGLWPRGLIIVPMYRYGYKFKTTYSGNVPGADYSLPSVNSSQTQHLYIIARQYSTIPQYVEKKFPVPLVVSVAYRSRFAGENFVGENSSIGLNVQLYFK